MTTYQHPMRRGSVRFSAALRCCNMCADWATRDIVAQGWCDRHEEYRRGAGTCPDWTPWAGAFAYAEEVPS